VNVVRMSLTSIPLLHHCAAHGSATRLRWFIDCYQPDINLLSHDPQGLTALFYACEVENARVLIAAGIDIHVKCKNTWGGVRIGEAVVSRYAEQGRTQMLQLLLEQGASPYAARRGHEAGYNIRRDAIHTLIRSYELRWNHCRSAVHALLALRRRTGATHWPRDMLYLLSRFTWSTRVSERWAM
jgi:hypothetical protein